MDQNLVRSLFTELSLTLEDAIGNTSRRSANRTRNGQGANTMNLIRVTSKLATDEPLGSRTCGQLVAGSRGHGQSLQLQAHDSYRQEA